MGLWRRRMPSSHYQPSGGSLLIPCEGVFQWGKTSFNSPKVEIRRECPLCGCRHIWMRKWKEWQSVQPNPMPGTGDWVNRWRS